MRRRSTAQQNPNPFPVPGKPETYIGNGRRNLPSITNSQRGVYHLLKHLGPSTAADLVRYYDAGRKFLDRGYRYPEQQPSGIRTRLAELVAKGWVMATEDFVYQDGSTRKRRIYKAV